MNLCGRSPATHRLVVRHYDRVGVLAAVLDGLREEGINVEEMENAVFAGAGGLLLDAGQQDPLGEALGLPPRQSKHHSSAGQRGKIEKEN